MFINESTKLMDCFREFPLCEEELDLERSSDLGREVELWNIFWNLDTNVISELIKGGPNPGVVQWIETHGKSALLPSVITFEGFGIAKPFGRKYVAKHPENLQSE